jgi:hypothetical protein
VLCGIAIHPRHRHVIATPSPSPCHRHAIAIAIAIAMRGAVGVVRGAVGVVRGAVDDVRAIVLKCFAKKKMASKMDCASEMVEPGYCGSAACGDRHQILMALAKFKRGWDGANAEPVDTEILHLLDLILQQESSLTHGLTVVPIDDGRVELAWQRQHVICTLCDTSVVVHVTSPKYMSMHYALPASNSTDQAKFVVCQILSKVKPLDE